MNKKVNYDEISSVYNERYKQSKLEGVEKFLKKLIRPSGSKNILEVGCGTAYWLNLFADSSFSLFGADLSTGMLNVAKHSNSNLNLINANSSALPIKKSSFDFIFVVNAIHLFNEHKTFIRDSYALLKPGGIFCIVGLEPRESEKDWFVYKYFENTFETDLKRYPTFSELRTVMNSSGFKNIEIETVHRIETYLDGENILSDHFAQKNGGSQLALLSDEDYKKGISKIKIDIDKASSKGEKIIFETKLNFYAITSIKPS